MQKSSNIYALQMKEEAKRMVIYYTIKADKLAKLKQSLSSQKLDRSQVSDLQKSSRWESENQTVLKERKPSNTQEPIESFLKSIKLENYVQKFKENGFEELEILFDIQKEQLQQMEIPLGHQIRLMKKIREARQTVDESKYEELEQPINDESFTNSVKKSILKKERNRSAKKVQFQKQEEKLEFNGMKSEIQSSLHNSFLLNQLEELSHYMHDNKIGEQQEMTCQTTEMITELFANSQLRQQEPYNEMSSSLLRVKKVACWNCYKLLVKDYLVKNSQEYCSFECFQKFNSLYIAQCVKCQKQFDIREGILLNGCSLCSEECGKDFNFQIMKDDEEEMSKQFMSQKNTEENERQRNQIVDLNFD